MRATTTLESAAAPGGLWGRCLERLQGHLSPGNFSSFVAPLQADESQPGVLHITAPNRYFQRYFQDHCMRHLQDMTDRHIELRVDGGGGAEPAAARADASGFEDTPLDPDFTFDNFVCGSSNMLALHAARAVARIDDGSGAAGPLLLYGGVGLGKTHLMQAIGNALRRRHPGWRIRYLQAEQFIRNVVTGARTGRMHRFDERYRRAEVFLIDDVHLFVGKRGSQEQMLHIFNERLSAHKQMVFTCDRYPNDLGMHQRLRSRLLSGMAVKVEPPGEETRAAIIMRKAEAMQLPLPESTAAWIARNIRSNVRALEGALLRIQAFARMERSAPSMEMVQTCLRDILASHSRPVALADIIGKTAAHYNLLPKTMLSRTRKQSVTRPRQMAMALAKELTNHSLPEIGAAFGGRDHTTVLHAVQKVGTLCAEDPQLKDSYERLKQALSASE